MPKKSPQIVEPKYDPKSIDKVVIGAGPKELIDSINDLMEHPEKKIIHLQKYLKSKEILTTKQIDDLVAGCNDPRLKEAINKERETNPKITAQQLIGIIEKHASTLGVDVNPVLNISNVNADIKKIYPNAKEIVNGIPKEPINYKDEEVNTIIVGAGPIGLLNAIGIMRKNPDAKIVMLEKYDEYKRNHTLRMDYKQVEKYIDAMGPPPDPALTELAERLKKNRTYDLATFGLAAIRISEVERLLKNRAVELGAQIITGSGISDLNEQVINKYQNANLILGADGTRGVVSEQGVGKSYVLSTMRDETQLEPGKLYLREKEGQLLYSVINNEGKEVRDKPLDKELFKVEPGISEKELMKKAQEIKKDIFEVASKNGDIKIVENSNKKEFDFVLQLRIEVEGDIKPIPVPTLARFMQNFGVTGEEVIGKKDENGKTPMTFQIMITKEQFKILEAQAKSGNPIRPFSGDDPRADIIPEVVMQQVKGYLGMRLRHYTKENDIVNLNTATISVNEAPATYAKEVYKQVTDSQGKTRDLVLVGDAAMGLSYFKGINAGFESCAKLLDRITQPAAERTKGLQDYKQWFEKDFAPGKVGEVGFYSNYVIGAMLGAFRTLKTVIGSDKLMSSDAAERTVDMYLAHLTDVNNAKQSDSQAVPEWKHAYEHDGRSLDNVISFQPKSGSVLLERIGKEVVDSVKPYKSTYHILRDLVTPLRSVYHTVVGGAQLALALPIELVNAAVGVIAPNKFETRMGNLKECGQNFLTRLGEGASRVLFGASLAVESVMLPVKLVSRAVSTALSGDVLIENNKEMSKLIAQTDELVKTPPKLTEDNTADNKVELTQANKAEVVKEQNVEVLQDNKAQMTQDNKSEGKAEMSQLKLVGLAVEIHRKFEKAHERGQKTEVDCAKEQEQFKKCVQNGTKKDFEQYFELFKQPSSSEKVQKTTEQKENTVSFKDYKEEYKQKVKNDHDVNVRPDAVENTGPTMSV